MTALDAALVAARGLNVACVMLVAGTLAVRSLVASVRTGWLLGIGTFGALASGGGWLLLQAASFAGGWDRMPGILPDVLFHTHFGILLWARVRLLLLAVAIAAASPRLGAIVAAACVAIQAFIGHGAADGDRLLEAALTLHVLAAAAWLGGLPALWLSLSGEQPARTVRRFSVLGAICVATIAATALVQAASLGGGLPGLIGTDYGHAMLVKLALFTALTALAALNHFVLTPRLSATNRPTSSNPYLSWSRSSRPSTPSGATRETGHIRRLRASVILECVLGLAVIGAAATLASLPPGAHEQPVWPFALRPSLDALADPDLRAEVMQALAMLAGGAALVLAGAILRRVRWPAIGAAALLAWLAAPHLRPLLVEAYPTSFFISPTGFTPASITQGARLFGPNCASCHGAEGHGDGPLAASLSVPPADLTAPHLWDHADGELFWWLTHGMDDPDGTGGLAMPGFRDTLDADQRWALIDYIRAHNTGLARRAGVVTPALPAPAITLQCADGTHPALASLRGRPLRIVDGPARPSPDVLTIGLNPAPPAPGTCADPMPEDREAFAILAGVTPDALAGADFLIDPDGWLRGGLRDDSPAALIDAIRTICTQHVAATSGGRHAHVH